MSDTTRALVAEATAALREGSTADSDSEPLETPIDSVTTEAATTAGDEPSQTAGGDDTSERSAVPATAQDDKKPDEDDDFEKEPEFTIGAGGRKQLNRIPQPRVKVMVDKAVAKAIEARDREHSAKVSEYEARVRNYDQIDHVAQNDPDRFISMLAQANPAYAKFLSPTTSARPAHNDNDPMPAPDLADGGYSLQQFRRVQEWNAQQTKKAVLDEVKKQYGWVDEIRAANETQQHSLTNVRSQIAEAQDWEGFKENYQAVLDELRKDSAEAQRTGARPKLRTLADAYRVVMHKLHKAEVEKLRTDRNSMRSDVIGELKKRPTSTATVPGTKPVAKNDDGDGDDSNSDGLSASQRIIRDATRKLRASGQ
jgi:hypothetical protein